MSTFEVYWILQLDKILEFGNVTTVLSFVLALAGIIVYGIGIDRRDLGPGSGKDFIGFGKKLIKLSVVGLCLALSIRTFVPSTNSFCAITIVPAIVNNEEITTNMPEIYRLGIERIRYELEKAEKLSLHLDKQ